MSDEKEVGTESDKHTEARAHTERQVKEGWREPERKRGTVALQRSYFIATNLQHSAEK